MSIHLQRQIAQLKKMLLSLGAMTEESLHSAILALRDRDTELAQRVVEGDKRIDLTEIDVEEECLHTLALHQPVAFDLRFVVSVLKINNDLERIGDLAVNIAEQAKFLASESEVDHLPYDLTGMSKKVEAMLRESLDAFVNIDIEKAQHVRHVDDEVDDIHRGMYAKVAKAMREQPDQIDQMIHLLNSSRQLERIADHACSIAKDVLYMAEGEIVRHAKRFRNAEPAPASEGHKA